MPMPRRRRSGPAPSRETAVTTAPAVRPGEVRIGRLVKGGRAGRLLVDFSGNAAGTSVPARNALALDAAALAQAVAAERAVVLAFEDGDARRPIVLGVIQPDEGEVLLRALLEPRGRASPPPPAPAAAVEARLDGRRVVLEAAEEVVLKCGDASITLRRDGKVIVRGAYVETHARGVNRIKGGSVKIN